MIGDTVVGCECCAGANGRGATIDPLLVYLT